MAERPRRSESSGFRKLLKGWHDSAALAAVDSWPLGQYDSVKHPDAIVRVDHVVVELARRFPDVHKLLQASCAGADLPKLLYADNSHGSRTEARGEQTPACCQLTL